MRGDGAGAAEAGTAVRGQPVEQRGLRARTWTGSRARREGPRARHGGGACAACYTGSPRRVSPRSHENRSTFWDRHGATENTESSLRSPRSQENTGRLWDRRDTEAQRNAPRGNGERYNSAHGDPCDAFRARTDRGCRGAAGGHAPRVQGGGRDRYRSGEGGEGSRRGDGPDEEVGRQGLRRRAQGDQGGKAGCRGAVHQFIAEEGLAADRRGPEAQGADRLDDGGAGVSGVLAQGPGRPHRQGGAEGESRRAGDGRQPGLHDGRTADHAHRRLRQCRSHHGQPDSGRAIAPAAVPAEDRLRSHARAVPGARGRRHRAARRASQNRSR